MGAQTVAYQITKSSLWWSMSAGIRPFGLYFVKLSAFCSPLSKLRNLVSYVKPSSSRTTKTFLIVKRSLSDRNQIAHVRDNMPAVWTATMGEEGELRSSHRFVSEEVFARQCILEDRLRLYIELMQHHPRAYSLFWLHCLPDLYGVRAIADCMSKENG